MCLVTKQIEPQIATEDITCYKVIRKNMTSLYYKEFKWEFGKVYDTLIEQDKDEFDTITIHRAFHSYESLDELRQAYFITAQPCMTVKCTIPKGSKVYKGKHSDIDGYASNQLIINEVIDVKALFPDFNWTEYPYKEGQIITISELDEETKNCKIENIQPSLYDNSVAYLILSNKTRNILVQTNTKGNIIKYYKRP